MHYSSILPRILHRAIAAGGFLLLLPGCELLFGPATGEVAVSSSSAGVQVYLNYSRQDQDASSGTTVYEMPPGSTEVFLYKSGLAPHREVVSVQEDKRVTVDFSAPTGSVLADYPFDDTSHISVYDNQWDIDAVRQEDSSGNGYAHITRSADNPDDWIVFGHGAGASDPVVPAVYEFDSLSFQGSKQTLYLSYYDTDEAAGYMYYFGQNGFGQEQNSDTEGIEGFHLQDLPPNRPNTPTKHTLIALDNRLLYLRNGEMLVNHPTENDPYQILDSIEKFQMEISSSEGDSEPWVNLDNLLIYQF